MREIRPRRRGRSLGLVKDGGGHHDDEYAQHDRWKSYEQMAPAQRLHVFESVSREHMRHRESKLQWFKRDWRTRMGIDGFRRSGHCQSGMSRCLE